MQSRNSGCPDQDSFKKKMVVFLLTLTCPPVPKLIIIFHLSSIAQIRHYLTLHDAT